MKLKLYSLAIVFFIYLSSCHEAMAQSYWIPYQQPYVEYTYNTYPNLYYQWYSPTIVVQKRDPPCVFERRYDYSPGVGRFFMNYSHYYQFPVYNYYYQPSYYQYYWGPYRY